MIAGIFACIFAVLGILTFGVIFVPIAALITLIGLLSSAGSGDFPGLLVNALAAVLTVIGFATSPTLLAITGMAVAASQARDHSPTPAPLDPPPAFAIRHGDEIPPGVVIGKDGLPEGYEMRSGASHGCSMPNCMYFVRTSKE
jgi:hypothetical protein